ncbi:hypothetical protein VNO77_44382 [Canavalia gladiata]|uniref:Uncharacterized protein n=1 Tax=Canavalia gladiata TaxID=3824 RepID=A0AAN9JYW1_CANGL
MEDTPEVIFSRNFPRAEKKPLQVRENSTFDRNQASLPKELPVGFQPKLQARGVHSFPRISVDGIDGLYPTVEDCIAHTKPLLQEQAALPRTKKGLLRSCHQDNDMNMRGPPGSIHVVCSFNSTHALSLHFKMENISMGIWVERFSNTMTVVQYFHNWDSRQYGCMKGCFTAHYQAPGQMIGLWDELSKGRA